MTEMNATKTVSLANTADDFILKYGQNSLLGRAIPHLIDGLVPVQRRVLYTAHKLGLAYLENEFNFVKSASVVGNCFVANTKVTTPDDNINIQDLSINDLVLTDIGIEPVTNVFVMPKSKILRITLEDGTSVDTTADQVFYDEEDNEITASSLTIGKKIKTLLV